MISAYPLTASVGVVIIEWGVIGGGPARSEEDSCGTTTWKPEGYAAVDSEKMKIALELISTAVTLSAFGICRAEAYDIMCAEGKEIIR